MPPSRDVRDSCLPGSRVGAVVPGSVGAGRGSRCDRSRGLAGARWRAAVRSPRGAGPGCRPWGPPRLVRSVRSPVAGALSAKRAPAAWAPRAVAHPGGFWPHLWTDPSCSGSMPSRLCQI